ncbi:MAG: DEAD/DEAH box helicase [Kofleriaceae bacterium]
MKEPLPERFDDLGLIEPIARAVREQGYERPTPIQARAIPHLLDGRDLLGLAQTGTGKTAAFALPIIQRLVAAPPPASRGPRPIRVLILTPTRELASQIAESFDTYGKYLRLKTVVIFGGVGMEPQKQALRAGLDVLVATPGRLLDLAGQGFLHLPHLEVFVLDEADRMLDMGFIHDVRRVIRLLPERKQTLFFSATMPPEAQQLADQLLKDPVRVAVAPVSSTAEKVEQELAYVDKGDKRALLIELLRDTAMRKVLVFSRTKHGANKIADHLDQSDIGAAAIHGNKSQSARERALADFKAGKIRVLVATDIAARGIDIDEITHVVNFDLPEVAEQYVHRIGRTARAGASGYAVSFCEADERELLVAIERLIRMKIPVIEGHPFEDRAPQPLRPGERVAMSPQAQMQARRDELRRTGGGGRRDHRRDEPRRDPVRTDASRPRAAEAPRPATPRPAAPNPAGAPRPRGGSGRRRRRGGRGGGGGGGGGL